MDGHSALSWWGWEWRWILQQDKGQGGAQSQRKITETPGPPRRNEGVTKAAEPSAGEQADGAGWIEPPVPLCFCRGCLQGAEGVMVTNRALSSLRMDLTGLYKEGQEQLPWRWEDQRPLSRVLTLKASCEMHCMVAVRDTHL